MLELLSCEVKFPKMALWWLFRSCHCQQKGKKNLSWIVGLRRANI